jgi:flagellar hook-basal body complex protein FliE
MSISGISPTAIAPVSFPSFDGADAVNNAGNASGGNFGSKLGDALQTLQDQQKQSDDLAMQAASGQLTDIHDYMIAATQAELTTQLTVAVRNKAVESFNQIMNMQV